MVVNALAENLKQQNRDLRVSCDQDFKVRLVEFQTFNRPDGHASRASGRVVQNRHFAKKFARLKDVKVFLYAVDALYKLNFAALNQVEGVARLKFANDYLFVLILFLEALKGRKHELL